MREPLQDRRETTRSVQVTVHPTTTGEFLLHVTVLRSYNRRPAVVRAAWGPPVSLGSGGFPDALRLAAAELLKMADRVE